MKKIVISSFFLIGIALFLSLDGEKLLQELKQELEKTEEKLFEKDKKLPAPKYTAQKFNLVGKFIGIGFSKKKIFLISIY